MRTADAHCQDFSFPRKEIQNGYSLDKFIVCMNNYKRQIYLYCPFTLTQRELRNWCPFIPESLNKVVTLKHPTDGSGEQCFISTVQYTYEWDWVISFRWFSIGRQSDVGFHNRLPCRSKRTGVEEQQQNLCYTRWITLAYPSVVLVSTGQHLHKRVAY